MQTLKLTRASDGGLIGVEKWFDVCCKTVLYLGKNFDTIYSLLKSVTQVIILLSCLETGDKGET